MVEKQEEQSPNHPILKDITDTFTQYDLSEPERIQILDALTGILIDSFNNPTDPLLLPTLEDLIEATLASHNQSYEDD